jgi:hypothetical protein
MKEGNKGTEKGKKQENIRKKGKVMEAMFR